MARNHTSFLLAPTLCLLVAAGHADAAGSGAANNGAPGGSIASGVGGTAPGRSPPWLRSSPARHFGERRDGDNAATDAASVASHGVLRIRLSDPRDPRSALGSFIIGPAGVVYLLEFE